MATIDKIWLGWVKRESGNAGFRCTNGDRGQAQGKYQFDFRYGLVPFMKYCVEHVPDHYSGFKKFINYGPGNRALVNNSELTALWKDLCNKYPEEFEMLQDTCAYQQYYLPVRKHLANKYGINLDEHSPALKGTAFSMSIRSGSESAANKFKGMSNSTSDETMIRTAHSTYGNQDADRWTQAGQLGDALNALKNGTYSEIVRDFDEQLRQQLEAYYKKGKIPSSETTSSGVIEDGRIFAIATGYGADGYENLSGSFQVYENACNECARLANEQKRTFYVYDDVTKEKKYTYSYQDSSFDINEDYTKLPDSIGVNTPIVVEPTPEPVVEEPKKEEPKKEEAKPAETPAPAMTPTIYAVAFSRKKNKYKNLLNSFEVYENAINFANSAALENKVDVNVYNDTTKEVIYTAKYADLLKAESAKQVTDEPKKEKKAKTSNVKPFRVGSGWDKDKGILGFVAGFDIEKEAQKSADASRKAYNKSFFVYDKEGNVLYTATLTNSKDQWYRVGLRWANGKCVGQDNAYSIPMNAFNRADELTTNTGTQYFVFDPMGSVCYVGRVKE